MASRERIKQLYYGDKKPSSKKYMFIGVLAIVVVLVLFFALGGEKPPSNGGTTQTTLAEEGGIDLDADVANIRNKLTRAVNDITKIQQSSGASASPTTTIDTASTFTNDIDSIIAKIE